MTNVKKPMMTQMTPSKQNQWKIMTKQASFTYTSNNNN